MQWLSISHDSAPSTLHHTRISYPIEQRPSPVSLRDIEERMAKKGEKTAFRYDHHCTFNFSVGWVSVARPEQTDSIFRNHLLLSGRTANMLLSMQPSLARSRSGWSLWPWPAIIAQWSGLEHIVPSACSSMTQSWRRRCYSSRPPREERRNELLALALVLHSCRLLGYLDCDPISLSDDNNNSDAQVLMRYFDSHLLFDPLQLIATLCILSSMRALQPSLWDDVLVDTNVFDDWEISESIFSCTLYPGTCW